MKAANDYVGWFKADVDHTADRVARGEAELFTPEQAKARGQTKRAELLKRQKASPTTAMAMREINGCASTTGLATESIFISKERFWSCCCAAEPRRRRPATLPRQRAWPKIGVLPLTEKLTNYDPALALVDDGEIAAFMADAFESGDASYIAHALGIVARAKGMTQIARDTGLSREQLYRSFSDAGNPTLKTTLAVMKALGIELSARTCSDRVAA
jgi:probable addiction module antidote protein